jgi:hypothetical protein
VERLQIQHQCKFLWFPASQGATKESNPNYPRWYSRHKFCLSLSSMLAAVGCWLFLQFTGGIITFMMTCKYEVVLVNYAYFDNVWVLNLAKSAMFFWSKMRVIQRGLITGTRVILAHCGRGKFLSDVFKKL